MTATRTGRARLTYANVVSTLALVVAVAGGGAAVAAVAKNSVGSPQIINGSVKGADLKGNSVTGKDIKESSLDLPAAPAAAFVKNGVGTTNAALDGTEQTLASVSFSAPAAGYAFVTGESSFFAGEDGGWISVWIKQNTVTKRFTYWDAGDVDGNIDLAQTVSVVVPVTKGSHTFTLVVDEVAPNDTFGAFWKPQITVQYLPTGAAVPTDTTSDRGVARK